MIALSHSLDTKARCRVCRYVVRSCVVWDVGGHAMVWKPALSKKTGEENIPSAEGKVGSRACRVAVASLFKGRASD